MTEQEVLPPGDIAAPVGPVDKLAQHPRAIRHPENAGKGRHLFQKGQSGNPAGRAKIDHTLRSICRAHTPEAINLLMEIARTSANDAARVTALNSILDRAYGKPPQTVVAEGEDGAAVPINFVFKIGE